MRWLGSGLLVVLGACPGIASDKPVPPARVVVSGKAGVFIQASAVRGEMRPGDDVQKKLDESLKQVTAVVVKFADDASIIVALPASAVQKTDLLNVVKKLAVSAEGILSSTDNPLLIKMAGKGDAKRAPVLIAEKVIWLDDANRKKFPDEGRVFVDGLIKQQKHQSGSETFDWGIANGDGVIPFTILRKVAPSEAGKRVRAAGTIRVVDGRLVFDASGFEAVEK